MHSILVLGAGMIGRAIARLLVDSGDYEVVVGDLHERALARISHLPGIRTLVIDVTDPTSVARGMRGCSSVVSACPFAYNVGIARAALEAGISYFDLTEDVETTRQIRRLAEEALPNQIFMPQCGLAPGFIGILGYHLTRGFDRLDEVRLRVGALPLHPSNALKYNLTWSTDGLINEYCNPCEVIHEGRHVEVLPLEGLEHFSLDGVDYEAFNTSGGLGTLWETLKGRVRRLNYKTVRYPGHRDLIAFLANDLRLCERRGVFKDLLEQAVPVAHQDVVLIFCCVTGWKDGYLTQVTDARKIYHTDVLGEPWSAIQITTASSLCAVVDLHYAGALPEQGFIRQEQVRLDTFLANRFGRCYERNSRRVTLGPGNEIDGN